MSIDTIQTKIKELEDELSKTKYNKATERHFARVKAQIAKLKEKVEIRTAKKGGSGEGFQIRKTGDASVVLVGFPSSGKSTLLNKLTNSESEVAAYAFTTLTVIPGTMEYEQAKIQILDVPGILAGAARGTGRGREVLAMVRNTDLILVLVDALYPEHHRVILKELNDSGLRINQDPPDVKIIKKAKGGLDISSTLKLTKLTKESAKTIMQEMKINNADVVIRTDIDMDELIDVIRKNRAYVPAAIILSKIDLVDEDRLQEILEQVKPDLAISVHENLNIDELKELIFSRLNFVRIYLKEVGKKPDLDEPMIVKKGITIGMLCGKIHRDFVNKFRFIRVWGKTAKFPGQMFRNLNKELLDGDIVEIHLD